MPWQLVKSFEISILEPKRMKGMSDSIKISWHKVRQINSKNTRGPNCYVGS